MSQELKEFITRATKVMKPLMEQRTQESRELNARVKELEGRIDA